MMTFLLIFILIVLLVIAVLLWAIGDAINSVRTALARLKSSQGVDWA